MSLILNIESAIDSASVCIAKHGEVLAFRKHAFTKDSAAWIQPAIRDVLQELGLRVNSLNAVAVSAGPGSYTGLRVGMATAKGLCFALNIPLITLNTLKIMASANPSGENLLCPMIDARRMEVFTAVYDHELNEILPPKNMILNDESFISMLDEQKITFFGNGSPKFKSIMQHRNAEFSEFNLDATHMIFLSQVGYDNGEFSDLAYSEPFYGKDFFTPAFKPSD